MVTDEKPQKLNYNNLFYFKSREQVTTFFSHSSKVMMETAAGNSVLEKDLINKFAANFSIFLPRIWCWGNHERILPKGNL